MPCSPQSAQFTPRLMLSSRGDRLICAAVAGFGAGDGPPADACWSPRAARTKTPKLGGLTRQERALSWFWGQDCRCRQGQAPSATCRNPSLPLVASGDGRQSWELLGSQRHPPPIAASVIT